MMNSRATHPTTRRSTVGAILTVGILALTLATAYIHLSLGGLLFTLNGLGYLSLAALTVIGAAVRHPVVERFSWFPRVALSAYALATIVGYFVMGPYITLGYIAKAIEVALIGLVALDAARVYGSPAGIVRAALDSVGLERSAS
jgi:hypothetical protein